MIIDTILVLTGRSPRRILREGGSGAWALDRERAKRCKYIVCTQNRYAGGWSDATESHGSGFLVGKICDVVPDPDRPERFRVLISEYARINSPNLWDGSRNPVRYTSLDKLGLDPSNLNFRTMDAIEFAATDAEGSVGPAVLPVRPLTIDEAKRGLAAKFGVDTSSIEIVIRA